MGAMPGNIVKGPLLGAFDDFINKPKAPSASKSNLEEALDKYNSGSSLDQIFTWGADKLGFTTRERTHIIEDWLAELLPSPDPYKPKSWWPKFYPLGETIREGLKLALNCCRYVDPFDPSMGDQTPVLPLDSYWLCAGKHFEIAVSIGKHWNGTVKESHHVNMLILTPSSPISDMVGSPLGDDNIWVVRPTDLGPGRTLEKEVGNVETVRIKRMS